MLVTCSSIEVKLKSTFFNRACSRTMEQALVFLCDSLTCCKRSPLLFFLLLFLFVSLCLLNSKSEES